DNVHIQQSSPRGPGSFLTWSSRYCFMSLNFPLQIAVTDPVPIVTIVRTDCGFLRRLAVMSSRIKGLTSDETPRHAPKMGLRPQTYFSGGVSATRWGGLGGA